MNSVVGSVEKALGPGKLEEAVVEVKNTLLKVQNFVSDVQKELQAMNLGKTGTNRESTTARLDKIVNSGRLKRRLSR